MGENSAIAWTHNTFNPWWGCTNVSAGCDHCYAETWAKRYGYAWGKTADRRFFGDAHWNEPLKWNKKASQDREPQRVFCSSMADIFEPRADLEPHRERLFNLIDDTPMLNWLLLTKRPENMPGLAPKKWAQGWPKNVWAGTTCESQATADYRVGKLLAVPAFTRFLSVEPMLQPVQLRAKWESEGEDAFAEGIHWVICGGESGAGYRPFNPEWARDLRDQCQAAGVAFFMKQLGGFRGGADIEKFPEDLRIRQFPA